MEGTHGQLGTGLTNRLSRNNTHGLANIDQGVRRHRTAIAQGAHTNTGLTGEHRTHAHILHASLEQLLNQHIRDILTSGCKYAALSVLHIHRKGASVNGGLNIRMQVCLIINEGKHQAAAGTTVMLTHNHILRHVHQTTG